MHDKKTKIVHIINSLDLGGAETALFRLLDSMHKANYELSVIVLNQAGYYSGKINALGVPISYLDMKKNNPVYALYRLTRLIKQIKPDIVQTWLYHADFFGGIAARLANIQKIIWGVRCEGVGLKKTTLIIKKCCALLSWVVPHHIVFNSQVSANHHIQTGYHPKKIHLIHNGFDIHQFQCLPNKNKTSRAILANTNAPSNAILFGTLARVHPDKDYATLIQAIDTVCAVNELSYFVLCGQGCHADNPALKTLLESISYSNRIILIDGVDDSPHYLNQLDVFILSSKTEGFPNSLAEAMLCQLPCIATDVGEVKDILADTGLLIPPGDAKQLALACIAMLNKTSHERLQLGELARQRVQTCYSMTNHITQMGALYTRCRSF